jgi:hypothetical protein
MGLEKKKLKKKERFLKKPAQNETVAGGWPIQSQLDELLSIQNGNGAVIALVHSSPDSLGL